MSERTIKEKAEYCKYDVTFKQDGVTTGVSLNKLTIQGDKLVFNIVSDDVCHLPKIGIDVTLTVKHDDETQAGIAYIVDYKPVSPGSDQIAITWRVKWDEQPEDKEAPEKAVDGHGVQQSLGEIHGKLCKAKEENRWVNIYFRTKTLSGTINSTVKWINKERVKFDCDNIVYIADITFIEIGKVLCEPDELGIYPFLEQSKWHTSQS